MCLVSSLLQCMQNISSSEQLTELYQDFVDQNQYWYISFTTTRNRWQYFCITQITVKNITMYTSIKPTHKKKGRTP